MSSEIKTTFVLLIIKLIYNTCTMNLEEILIWDGSKEVGIMYRVKLGIFEQTARFGQRPCLFHISNIGIKNKLTKQTVKILMRRLIRSRLIWIYTVCKRASEFT